MGAEVTNQNGRVDTIQGRLNWVSGRHIVSGGALGISFTFLDKLFPHGGTAKSGPLLLIAWGLWTLSLVAVLISHYLSVLALRETVRQVDARRLPGDDRAGGRYDWWLEILNPAAGIAFAIGLVSFVIFVLVNLLRR